MCERDSDSGNEEKNMYSEIKSKHSAQTQNQVHNERFTIEKAYLSKMEWSLGDLYWFHDFYMGLHARLVFRSPLSTCCVRCVSDELRESLPCNFCLYRNVRASAMCFHMLAACVPPTTNRMVNVKHDVRLFMNVCYTHTRSVWLSYVKWYVRA